MVDIRQIKANNIYLPQIAEAEDKLGSDLIVAIDTELTSPLQMRAALTPSLVVSVGPIIVTNTIHGRHKTLAPINGDLPSFTSGTFTLPSASGGNITFSTGGSVPVALTCPSGSYVKVLIFLDVNGNLGAVVGVSAVTEAAALVPKQARGVFNIGYISVHNTAGTIDNVLNTKIFQFLAGAGGGGGGASLEGESAIANNQVVPADVTDFLLDPVETENVKVDYSIVRKYNGLYMDGFNDSVRSVINDPAGGFIVGGQFSTYNSDGSCPNYLCRLNADMTLDTSWNYGSVGFDGNVLCIVADPAGGFIVGGDFTSYNGDANCPNRLCKINADGTLNTSWNYGNSGCESTVYAIVIAPDGNLMVGGTFTSYNAVTTCPDFFCKINILDGTLNAWNNGASNGFNGPVYAVINDPAGGFIVGGSFTSYNGSATCPDRVCKIDASGTLNALWASVTAGAGDGLVSALAVHPSGGFVIGGTFTTYNGDSACTDRIARLQASGALDYTWNPSGSSFPTGQVRTIINDTYGFIVGGTFSSYNGNSNCPDCLCKLTFNGYLDLWNLGASTGFSGLGGIVYSAVVSPSSGVIVGGTFSACNGDANCPNCLASIALTGAAGIWQFPNTYYSEIGQFYVQYDLDTLTWTIGGETFTGVDAGVDLSMAGDQLQYISSGISGTVVKNVMKYSVTYL